MVRDVTARILSFTLIAAVAVPFSSGSAGAQACRCTPAQFAGACKATVAHVQGQNSLKVTSDSQRCSFVEWTYKDGTKDSEFVIGGVNHKIALFDLTRPKPEIGATQCNICAGGEAPMQTASAAPIKSNQVDAQPAGGLPAPTPSTGDLAADMKRQLQQEFAGTPGTGSVTENWDDVLSKVDEGNKQFAEQQRLLALRRQQEEEVRRAQEEAERLEREAQLAEQQYYAPPEPEYQGPNLLDMLNMIGREVQRETAASQRRFDQTMANAQAQAARQKAEQARAEAERMQAQNEQRMAALQAQQQQLQQQQQQAMRNANAAEQARLRQQQQDLERQRQLTQQREQEAIRQRDQQMAALREEERAHQDAERARRQAEAQRRAEDQRMAALRRDEEGNRRVEFKEGVVLCQQQNPRNWRCEGPLQVTYANLQDPNSLRTNVSGACGGGAVRDLGMTGGFRAFGCGFGIHPTDRNYPGNRDIPAKYGLYIADRAAFFCKRSVDAYCRDR